MDGCLCSKGKIIEKGGKKYEEVCVCGDLNFGVYSANLALQARVPASAWAEVAAFDWVAITEAAVQ